MGALDTLPLREKMTLEIPQDVIPVEGIAEVNNYLYKELIEAYPKLREYAEYDRFLNRDFARDWVVNKGTYTGTFPKRVASFLYKQRSIRLTAEQQSEVGNIAKRHCTKSSTFVFDITDTFDWEAGDFGDAGSCYWSDRRQARKLLRHYGARAIRFYRPDKPTMGIARAWLAPIVMNSKLYSEKMVMLALDEAQRQNLFVVFNGYGHETQRAARILATHLGLSYCQVGLSNEGNTGGTLWINHYSGVNRSGVSSSAFLIGPTAELAPIEAVDLMYDVNQVDRSLCDGTCGQRYRSHDLIEAGGRSFCRPCYDVIYFNCNRCHDGGLRTEAKQVVVGTVRGIKHETWCQRCAQANAFACTHCHETFSVNIKITPEENEDPWCRECFVTNHQICTKCELWRENGQITAGTVCKTCKKE